MRRVVVLTKGDLAKYPFTKEAAEYVASLKFDIEEFSNPIYASIIERAEERIREAVEKQIVSVNLKDEDIEIVSYPIAILMVSGSKNDYLKKRYALAEARRAEILLKSEEDLNKIIDVALTFNWRIRKVNKEFNGRFYHFAINFIDYLRNAVEFHDIRWKLVNRTLIEGEVYLTKDEVARLLREEIRRKIENKTSEVVPRLPSTLQEKLSILSGLVSGKIELNTDFSSLGVNFEAFPPCIRKIYNDIASKRHVSHMGRFTLTTFLLSIGMDIESIVKTFTALTDFDERKTRYQVEHIAGERGSRTRYTPPKCETLRTHGLCVSEGDQLCSKVKHPLLYYKRKLLLLRRKKSEK